MQYSLANQMIAEDDRILDHRVKDMAEEEEEEEGTTALESSKLSEQQSQQSSSSSSSDDGGLDGEITSGDLLDKPASAMVECEMLSEGKVYVGGSALLVEKLFNASKENIL
jgi:hypothetical protein